ncbi:MAG TPA: lysophospholipid acyltransferase family protein [Nitriliruptorales bacterium]
MNPVYAVVIGIVLLAFRVLRWKVVVRGAENVPADGPAVIATNHISYLDFVFCGAGARKQRRRRVRFVAKRETFTHPVTGPLMRAMRHISVDRGGDTDATMADVRAALAAGDLVGMFPEGTINRSFVPGDARPGAARMAIESGAPLVPCAIWGSQRIFTKGHPFRAVRNVVITVEFGVPIPYKADDDPVEVTTRLMASVAQMVDGAQRDYPQQPTPGEEWWQPAHLGGGAPTPEEARVRAEAEAAERRARRQAALEESDEAA